MYHHNWKKELITIPNLLSIFRLLLIPVYTTIYLNASNHLDYYLAGSVLGLSCLTDYADGQIARSCNMITELGKLLDPLADKLTQFAMFLSLSQKYALLLPVMGIFLVKECFQCFALILFAHKGKALEGALFAGKICTAVLFISMILLVLFPDMNMKVVQSLIYVDAAFLFFSFLCYFRAYWGNHPKLKDLSSD